MGTQKTTATYNRVVSNEPVITWTSIANARTIRE
jgi:hypothetical protein